MPIGRWKRKLRRFSELERADRWLLARAAWRLLVARIVLAVVPFRRVAARLSSSTGMAGEGIDATIPERVGRAVTIAANHVPWRADCFPRTIAARALLQRYGYASTIHFGVRREGAEGLDGHAWLTCGNKVVTGGADLDRYTEVYRLGQTGSEP